MVVVILIAGSDGFTQNKGQKIDQVVLARNGKALASIVISKAATRSAQLAAYELQFHLNKITNAQFQIITDDVVVKGTRILVGESKLTKTLGLKNSDFKGFEEYIIKFSSPETIVLMGKDKDDRGKVKYDFTNDLNAYQTWPGMWDERGTMNAVYDFLERFCDVRWFNPTDFGTDYPEKAILVVKIKDIYRAPVFHYRHAATYYLNPDNYEYSIGLWQYGKAGLNQYQSAAYSGNEDVRRGEILIYLYRMRHGGEKCHANHSLYGYYERFWEKNPNNPTVFVEKKPDWFAQGVPLIKVLPDWYPHPGYEDQMPSQLCYTSPGLIQQQVQDARDYFDGNGIDYLVVGICEIRLIKGRTTWGDWVNVGKGDAKYIWGENNFCIEPLDDVNFCKCSRCQEMIGNEPRILYSCGIHSDYMFNFVNEVAKEIQKTHPDKRISTLAYMTHAYPPKKHIRFEPNVAVHFCFANNRLVYATGEYENEIKALKQWRTEYKELPLYLWLYYTFPREIAENNNFYCFPGFFAHKIGEQFKLFHELGIRGMYFCGYGQEVEAYVTYKLMDDPTLNVDELLNDYFSRYYGKAGRPMKELYESIEETYCNPDNYPKGALLGHQTEQIAWGNLGTKERMAKFEKLMKEAKKLAETDLEKKRVELFELGVWNYMVNGYTKYYVANVEELERKKSDALGWQEKLMEDLTKTGWARINCGDVRLYEDPRGNRWLPDQSYFSHGAYGNENANFVDRGNLPIEGTDLDKVYQTEAWGNHVFYRIPVPKGQYNVYIHFAETYGNKAPGLRQISVKVEGNAWKQKVDPFAMAGGFARSLVLSENNVDINDGIIDIEFTGGVGVNGIEIERLK